MKRLEMTGRLAAAVLALGLAVGCGADEERKPVEANFQSIHDNMLTLSCASSGCHGGSKPASNLAFDKGADAAYAALMTRATEGGLLRVEPFEPEQSELYLRLTGTSKSGALMPQTGKLPSADLTAVYKWIADGAER